VYVRHFGPRAMACGSGRRGASFAIRAADDVHHDPSAVDGCAHLIHRGAHRA